MNIKVWYLAVDGPKAGTVGGAFATRREAYEALIEAVGMGDNEELKDISSEGDLDAVDDWLEEKLYGMTTWDIGETELEVPVHYGDDVL